MNGSTPLCNIFYNLCYLMFILGSFIANTLLDSISLRVLHHVSYVVSNVFMLFAVVFWHKIFGLYHLYKLWSMICFFTFLYFNF